MKINTKQIQLFSGTTEYTSLDGGEGDSLLSGNYVIKPVYETEKYEWLAGELRQIDFGTIAVSIPVTSIHGNYIEDGAGAAAFIPGTFSPGRLTDKLSALRLFNSSMKKVRPPAFFSNWTSPWTEALAIAWNTTHEVTHEAAKILAPLFKARQPLQLDSQFVHVDPAGNILFDNEKPVIIDVSPGFFPTQFSEVVLMCDSIAWYNAPLESFELLQLSPETLKQLIIRVLLFRAAVCLGFDSANAEGVKWSLEEYKQVLEYVNIKCL